MASHIPTRRVSEGECTRPVCGWLGSSVGGGCLAKGSDVEMDACWVDSPSLTRRVGIGRSSRRRGLAPLEMVLWLPILLAVAGLMVSLGTMTAWRLRGEVAARDVVWKVRAPGTGANEGHPPSWPESARLEVKGDSQISDLDDPEIDHDVVRRELSNGFQLNDLLKPDVGAIRGESEITRRHVMMASAGNFESGTIADALLTDQFRYSEMGIPSNTYRRARVLWEWPDPDPSLEDAFDRAYQAILGMANYEYLRVLDDDVDFNYYRGSAPDFHPRIRPNLCELDPEVVWEEKVKPLVDHTDDQGRPVKGQISKVPRTMTDAFQGLYSREVARLERLLEADPPVLSAAQKAAAQQEIKKLETYIDQLTEYEKSLQQAGI